MQEHKTLLLLHREQARRTQSQTRVKALASLLFGSRNKGSLFLPQGGCGEKHQATAWDETRTATQQTQAA
ncbi:MAG: hypothetical protein NVSMB44_34250 [Ktedonobacteraceae bacterium]